MESRRLRGAAIAALAAAVAAAGCAGRQPRVRVLPPRAQPGVEAPSGQAIAQTAESMLGMPYRDGGAGPDGFDCSGLVSYVFAQHGIAVPRDVRRQASAGAPVDRAGILPGDLVFFAIDGPDPTHVGIAMEAGRFVHAPKRGAVVRIEALTAAYWSARLVAIRRLWDRSDTEKR